MQSSQDTKKKPSHVDSARKHHDTRSSAEISIVDFNERSRKGNKLLLNVALISASAEDKYGFFVGGKYNSPRCINTEYSTRKESQHIGRSLIEKDSVHVFAHEASTDPFLLSKKREQQKYSVQNQFFSNYAATREQESHKLASLSPINQSNKLLSMSQQLNPLQFDRDLKISKWNKDRSPNHGRYRTQAKQQQQDNCTKHNNDVNQKLPTMTQEVSPTNEVKSTKQRKVLKHKKKHTQKEINDVMVQTLKEFDRTQMFSSGQEPFEEMLDPNNFPPDMFPTIDFLRRKKNMMRNNYNTMIPERVQKKFTPYRHYVNYRMAVEHVFNQPVRSQSTLSTLSRHHQQYQHHQQQQLEKFNLSPKSQTRRSQSIVSNHPLTAKPLIAALSRSDTTTDSVTATAITSPKTLHPLPSENEQPIATTEQVELSGSSSIQATEVQNQSAEQQPESSEDGEKENKPTSRKTSARDQPSLMDYGDIDQ